MNTTLNRKTLVVLFILILCLLGFTLIQQASCSMDGKTLTKTWTGDTSDVHNIVITIGGQVYWNSANLPTNNTMSFTPFLHGTPYTITWKDAFGPHSESGTVDCDAFNVQAVVNDIPYPKFIEQQKMGE
jgi:hypothetical protein